MWQVIIQIPLDHSQKTEINFCYFSLQVAVVYFWHMQ